MSTVEPQVDSRDQPLRPSIYKVEQYSRRSGPEAARFFKKLARSFYEGMPGVRSVRAYQGRFGFGPSTHDIEIWIEIEDMASLDFLEEWVVSHQEQVVEFEAELAKHFEERGSRLMGDWPDPRWSPQD